MTGSRLAWALGRRYIGWPVKLAMRPHAFGRDRVPRTGGMVYAMNHLHWIDIPVVGQVSPRNIDFVAKIEAVRVPLVGKYLTWHGAIAVRRGESDRVAVRKMLEAARAGRVVGLFVEGTRQTTGRPGPAQPGAAMVAIQADVPVVPVAVYGTPFWRPGNFKPTYVVFGEPVWFDELPKSGRGYRQATAEIERRINVLFDWAADVYAGRRPKSEDPPL